MFKNFRLFEKVKDNKISINMTSRPTLIIAGAKSKAASKLANQKILRSQDAFFMNFVVNKV